MGVVTDYLYTLLHKQVAQHGLVVWYDPEGAYTAALPELQTRFDDAGIAHAAYDGSFFALRHAVEQHLRGLEPPRLVVYVSASRDDADYALIEMECAGVVVQPGQQPPTRNTRLAIVGRNALREALGETMASKIEQQIEQGKLSLSDLDAIADKGGEITDGVTTVIFGSGKPQDVALAFLSDDAFDQDLLDKQALPELALLLQSAFGADLPPAETPSALRNRFARYVLASDLLHALGGQQPDALHAVAVAPNEQMRAACAHLARDWRQRLDLRTCYARHASTVEKELGIPHLDLPLEKAVSADTFLALEGHLQRKVVEVLQQGSDADAVTLARKRQSHFWAEFQGDVQAEWALIETCGLVLAEAARIEHELKSATTDATTLYRAYVEGETPWCLLDTHHRHMERRHHELDLLFHDRHQALQTLVARCRTRYMDVTAALAERFSQAFQKAGFRLGEVLLQTDVFDRHVRPTLHKKKTAYVLVDALRFEMARELIGSLDESYNVQLDAALATVPTITEIGMAALLPLANRSLAIVPGKKGKLALQVDDVLLKDRPTRVAYLQETVSAEIFETKLDNLLPMPRKRIQEGIERADLIFVTSQEIDTYGEGDSVQIARRIMDRVLYELQRAFRILFDLGVEQIVFAADHGYLFGEALGEDMKFDPPGGRTVDLHRRAWVGEGGATHPAYFRTPLAAFGIPSDLDGAFPRSFSIFKVPGGSLTYFHGGVSLQEVMIPVATLTRADARAAGRTGDMVWDLVPGSQKLSTRFYSVLIKGWINSLFEAAPPRVRLEIRARGQAISTPISASYGFEEGTGDVLLRLATDTAQEIEPNTITLMVTEEPDQKTVSVHLVDAESGVELKTLKGVDVAIAI